ncbi:MAG: GH25 family lysozyme, partial [Kordiimonas sp.]
MWGRLFLLSLPLVSALTACSSSTLHKQGLNGIDVSHFQKTIDWSSVKADGIDFAYIKVSEGITITDADLKTN